MVLKLCKREDFGGCLKGFASFPFLSEFYS